jgi:hypothetical protein
VNLAVMQSAEGGTRVAKSLSDEMLDELWLRARSSVPALFAVFLACEPAVAPLFAPHPAARAAYVATFVVMVLRLTAVVVVGRRLASLSFAIRYWLYTACALAVAGSMAWLSFLAVHYLDLSRLGIWVIFVSGVCGGSTISLGSRLDVFFAYVGLISRRSSWDRSSGRAKVDLRFASPPRSGFSSRWCRCGSTTRRAAGSFS